MMLVYSPANVGRISMQNAIQGNSPSLSDIDVAFGKGSALTWLVMWITEVYATCGFIGERKNENKRCKNYIERVF